MTKEEKAKFIHLINKLRAEHLTIPKMPIDIFLALNKIVPLPAVEVIVTTNGKNYLLLKRHDKYWDGWHIPGGFIGLNESIEKACKRVAKDELGITIEFEVVLGVYAWSDHPYASSISIICKCTTMDVPRVGKFFTKIPKKIIKHHDEFINSFLQNKYE